MSGIIDRDNAWNVQTPQAFLPQVLTNAHRSAMTAGITDASDDIQLVLRNEGRAVVVESDPTNVKITHPCDVEMLRKILENSENNRADGESPENA